MIETTQKWTTKQMAIRFFVSSLWIPMNLDFFEWQYPSSKLWVKQNFTSCLHVLALLVLNWNKLFCIHKTTCKMHTELFISPIISCLSMFFRYNVKYILEHRFNKYINWFFEQAISTSLCCYEQQSEWKN